MGQADRFYCFISTAIFCFLSMAAQHPGVRSRRNPLQSRIPKPQIDSSFRSYPVKGLKQVSVQDSEPCTPQADFGCLETVVQSNFQTFVDGAGGAEGDWLIGVERGDAHYLIDELEDLFEDAEEPVAVKDDCREEAKRRGATHHTSVEITPIPPAKVSRFSLLCAAAARFRHLTAFASFRWLQDFGSFALQRSTLSSPASQLSSSASRSSRCLTEQFNNVAASAPHSPALLPRQMPQVFHEDAGESPSSRPHPLQQLHQLPCRRVNTFCFIDDAVDSCDGYESACSFTETGIEGEGQSEWALSSSTTTHSPCFGGGEGGRRGNASPALSLGGASSGGVSISLNSYLLESSFCSGTEYDVTQWLMDDGAAEELEELEGEGAPRPGRLRMRF